MFSGHTFPSGVTAMLVRCISTGDTGSCLCCNFAQAASWFFQQVYSVFLTVLLMFPPHWRWDKNTTGGGKVTVTCVSAVS